MLFVCPLRSVSTSLDGTSTCQHRSQNLPSKETTSLGMSNMATPSWERPTNTMHAHFDCFSGAAGDMMLASCLDAVGTEKAPLLLQHVQNSLENGLPELKGEFSIEMKRVWRSTMGSIAATYVFVNSKYGHAPAPVPTPADASAGGTQETGHSHSHSHAQQENHSHNHSHSHGHFGNDSKHKSSDDVEKHHALGEESHDHAHSHHAAEEPKDTHNEPKTKEVSHAHDHSHSKDDIHSHSHGHSHTHSNDDGHSHSHGHGHSHSHSGDDDSSSGPLRNLPEIRKMLKEASPLFISPWVEEMGIAAFEALAMAEAATHGASSADTVHFHEVGAVDSIVDTIGTLLALEALGVKTVSCSRLPLGEGTVWTDHGLLPVPAPATLRLLVDMPTCPGPVGITSELVTPTAAALLKALTTKACAKKPKNEKLAGRPPCFTMRQIGIGAGTKDFAKHPNILRLMLGDNVVEEDRIDK